MVGSAEINIFEVRRSSTTVFLTYRIELVLPHLFESRKPTCDTRVEMIGHISRYSND